VARTLILDSEALNALARAKERPALALRARAILEIAHEEHALVRVPAAVLAELCRGGALLAAAKLGSAHAVDAFVVATAAELAPAVIATHDRQDLTRLSATVRDVRIVAI
jgi:predicted nucleic acid-binding protein